MTGSFVVSSTDGRATGYLIFQLEDSEWESHSSLPERFLQEQINITEKIKDTNYLKT